MRQLSGPLSGPEIDIEIALNVLRRRVDELEMEMASLRHGRPAGSVPAQPVAQPSR